MTELGYSLKELYEYSIKEILFILKYRREGIAYDMWRRGYVERAANHAKVYPQSDKELVPELFEKQTVKMPDWLMDDYVKKVQEQVNRSVRITK